MEETFLPGWAIDWQDGAVTSRRTTIIATIWYKARRISVTKQSTSDVTIVTPGG
jgi:hypothetical protein